MGHLTEGLLTLHNLTGDAGINVKHKNKKKTYLEKGELLANKVPYNGTALRMSCHAGQHLWGVLCFDLWAESQLERSLQEFTGPATTSPVQCSVHILLQNPLAHATGLFRSASGFLPPFYCRLLL